MTQTGSGVIVVFVTYRTVLPYGKLHVYGFYKLDLGLFGDLV